jgi:hypothetical protein
MANLSFPFWQNIELSISWVQDLKETWWVIFDPDERVFLVDPRRQELIFVEHATENAHA